MGKLTLLIVFAAVLGASVLSLSVRSTSGETGRARSETQASLLARQIAESGRGVVLTDITDVDGFKTSPSFSSRAYNGGEFAVDDYATLDERMKASFTIRGEYGGATHTLRNTYVFDPMEFPGPIWIDVPYATTAVAGGAKVSGGGVVGADVFVDQKKFKDYGVATLGSSLASTVTSLGTALKGGAQVLQPYDIGTVKRPDGQSVIADLGGPRSADDLYFAVVNAKSAGDQTFATSQTVGSSLTWGGAGKVTHVQGNLTVTGTLKGSGALAVAGNLIVTGTLDWTGIVIVRSTEDFNRVRLTGDVTIDGSLVIAQDAFPPGGHLDLTVARDVTGAWTNPYGVRTAGPGALTGTTWTGDKPWLMHVHKFDEVSGTRNIRFVDQAGSDPHEAGTRLRELLKYMGTQTVQLEFANAGNHGQSLFSFDLAGKDAVTGPVARGFEAISFAEAGQPFRTQPFAASDLEAFSVNVQSLLRLKKLWDTEGTCAGGSWPSCVGLSKATREDALTVRLVQATSGKVIYEASIYWHYQEGERKNYLEVELPAWQASLAGGTYGTAIELGKKVNVTYKLGPIVALSQKLGFDGNEVHLIKTEVVHETVNEARVAASADLDPKLNVTMCHKNGNHTVLINEDDVQARLAQGYMTGYCAAAPTPPSAPPSGCTWEWSLSSGWSTKCATPGNNKGTVR